MSQRWAIILVVVAFTSVGASIAILVSPHSVEAAKEPVKIGPPRIAYVNITKVLREFKKANVDEKAIAIRRRQLVDRVQLLRDSVIPKPNHLVLLDEAKRAQVEKERRAVDRQIDELIAEAIRSFGELTDKAIVETYQNIKTVIAELAQERGLDVVEVYPDALNEAEDRKPAVAQLKLQTAALMPIYIRPEFLVTDEIIERLNKKFPVAEGQK